MRSKSAWLPIVLSLVLVLFLALLIKVAGHTRPVRAATEFTVCPSRLTSVKPSATARTSTSPRERRLTRTTFGSHCLK